MANKYIKPVIDPNQFKANPLVAADFKIIINRVVDGKTFHQDNDGDWLPKEYDLEKETVTKMYTKPEYRLVTTKLSSKAQRLYLWLIYEVDTGKDYLWINKLRYMEENNITSINTYKTALAELSRYLIIYPSLVKEVYWINPRLFFGGNRVNKYPNNVEVADQFGLGKVSQDAGKLRQV